MGQDLKCREERFHCVRGWMYGESKSGFTGEDIFRGFFEKKRMENI